MISVRSSIRGGPPRRAVEAVRPMVGDIVFGEVQNQIRFPISWGYPAFVQVIGGDPVFPMGEIE